MSSSNVLNDLSRQRKVSNASQDSARPTSASNRLSPSKRTNDMPQVNSATTAPHSKDLHKSSIPSGKHRRIFFFVFVLMGLSLLPNALRPFKIYCAPPNLGIMPIKFCSETYFFRLEVL